MKKSKLICLLLLGFVLSSFKNQDSLINWSVNVNKIKENLFEVKYIAKIKEGYLLSSVSNNEFSVNKTDFKILNKTNLFSYPIIEHGNKILVLDTATNTYNTVYKEQVIFTQLVRTSIDLVETNIQTEYAISIKEEYPVKNRITVFINTTKNFFLSFDNKLQTK